MSGSLDPDRVAEHAVRRAQRRGNGASDWEPTVPLDFTGGLTEFPTEVLPPWGRAWVEAEATALQVPVCLPALLYVAVLAALLQKRFEVIVKPGWIEALVLWVLVALPPGEGKSPAFRVATAPLREFEYGEAKRLGPRLAELQVERDVMEQKLQTAKKSAASSQDRALQEDARRIARELEALPTAVVPRLLIDDATPEAVVRVLAEQRGRIALLSAEGGAFATVGGRYARGVPNVDAFNQAWCGETIRVDRIGRAPLVVRNPCITIGVAVQPDVVRRLSKKQELRGTGFLARFLYAIPRSKVGCRDADPPSMPSVVSESYRRGCLALASAAERTDAKGEVVPHALNLSAEAKKTLLAFKKELEPHLGPGGDLHAIADWANKLPGQVARIAGLLHLAGQAEAVAAFRPGDGGEYDAADRCDSVDGVAELELASEPASRQRAGLEAVASAPGDCEGCERFESEISDEAVAAAARVGWYLVAHARAAFALMGEDPSIVGARHLVAYVRRRGATSVKHRDLQQATRQHFSTYEDFERSLSLVLKHGHLRETAPASDRKTGRPPKPVYQVNPYVLAQYPQNAPDGWSERHETRATGAPPTAGGRP